MTSSQRVSEPDQASPADQTAVRITAHADADQLLRWLGHAGRAPAAVSIVHGEPSAADALRRRLGDELGWEAAVAMDHQTVAVGIAGRATG